MNSDLAPSADAARHLRFGLLGALTALCLLLTACAPAPILKPAADRPFVHGRDTFAFANELVWAPRGGKPRPPTLNYHHRCFVMSRSARQFFQFARFDPSAPALDEEEYRERVRQVIAHSPDEEDDTIPRIVIPGYANLHAFSTAHAGMLKETLGSSFGSFVQRGHWRMVFPFTGSHQEAMAETLLAEIGVNRPPVVHLITFPHITINHALLLFEARESEHTIEFFAYDPNDAERKEVLTYDCRQRRFRYPPNDYFEGGELAAYEIYRPGGY